MVEAVRVFEVPGEATEASLKVGASSPLPTIVRSGDDPFPWTVKQLNFDWADFLRFGPCCELSTAGRRVAHYDHDAGRRWTTRQWGGFGFVRREVVRSGSASGNRCRYDDG